MILDQVKNTRISAILIKREWSRIARVIRLEDFPDTS